MKSLIFENVKVHHVILILPVIHFNYVGYFDKIGLIINYYCLGFKKIDDHPKIHFRGTIIQLLSKHGLTNLFSCCIISQL